MINRQRVGLIGLGAMGLPMARNWLSKGFLVTVLPHKNQSMIIELREKKAQIASTLEELVKNSDVIVLMLPSSREVEDLTVGVGGLLSLLNQSQIVIDMTTSEPDSTRMIFKKFKEYGFRFFDAPVTGGVTGAAAGTLTLFMGGPSEWISEVRPVLEAVSTVQTHFGDIGSGNTAKVINNFICIGNIAVFSEALPLAKRLGLEPERLFKTLLSGMASSEVLKFYTPQILKDDFKPRFKLAHAYKDLRIAETMIKALGISTLPVLGGALEDFKQAMAQGLDQENTSALIKPVEEKLGARFRSS